MPLKPVELLRLSLIMLTIEITGGNNQTRCFQRAASEPLGIRVEDSRGRPVPGLAVTFECPTGATLEPVIGTDVYLTTVNAWASAFSSDLNDIRQATRTVPADITEGDAALVQTDRSGEAQVYFQLGTDGNKTVDC